MTISEKAGAMAKSGLAGVVLGKKKKSTENANNSSYMALLACVLRRLQVVAKGHSGLCLDPEKSGVSTPKNPMALHSINLTLSSGWQGQVIRMSSFKLIFPHLQEFTN